MAGKKRLLWRLYSSYLALTVFSLLAVGWFSFASLHDFYLERTAAGLEVRAGLLQEEVLARLAFPSRQELQSLVRSLGERSSTRITVILPDGEVAADSDDDPARMENQAQREEVRLALARGKGSSVRYSHTVRKNLLYFAVPLRKESRVVAVLRTAVPLTDIELALAEVRDRIVLGAILVAAAAAGVCWWISRRISRPLEEMKRGAERFAGGELQSRLPVADSDEVGGLAQALNEMAARLDERLRTALRQRNEQQAVLSSMVEGVLAVDGDERLISLNRAAASLFGVRAEEALGKSLAEAVRNVDLQRFVVKVLASAEPVEAEIVLRDKGERFLQAHGASLRDDSERRIGALVVLNDVTRLRRLENVRKDFVANVSHELKTPITSIKGFVETLRDGAMNRPEERERFLEIVASQADRLNAIIEDLLTLSRIEQEAERAEIPLEPARVRPILEAAVQACAGKAGARDIRVELHCESGLAGRVNAPLLEQAVVNLLDNAIKYSEPGKKVEIACVRREGEIRIDVRDQGCGIERQHLPRIFERFYRVDKSRSRKLGGTGLGLAIVKHIAQAHHGRVSVESASGAGSAFSIFLPAA